MREVYCRAPLYVPGPADKFARLLSWDGLNRATTLQRTTRHQLRLAKNGKAIPEKNYSTKQSGLNGEYWSIDFRAVGRLLEDGATLVCDRIDEVHESIADLCRALEAELGAPSDAVAFASWRQMQGFPTHWDYEAGFVLQLDGTKHWRVFKPERLHPTEQDFKKSRNETPSTEPYWEGDLKPGDLLYMPGGWWHDAIAVTGRSLHVTLATYPPSGLALLSDIVRELQDEEFARAPLPRFGSEIEQRDYMARLRGAVDAKLRDLTVKSFLGKLDANARARARLSMPWSALAGSDGIPTDAWIHWLAPRPITMTQAGTDEITFAALNDRITIAVVAQPLVQELASRRKAPFKELCSAHPGLPVETILLELVSAGLVAIAEHSTI